MTDEASAELIAGDRESHQRDLFDAIEKGDFPRWNVQIQVMTQAEADAWSSKTVPFRATLETEPEAVVERVRRNLPRIDEPTGRQVIRAQRLFDGIGGDYLENLDILIEGGRIVAVGPRAEHPGAIVIDMGDLTILPGLVDVPVEGVQRAHVGARVLLEPALQQPRDGALGRAHRAVQQDHAPLGAQAVGARAQDAHQLGQRCAPTGSSGSPSRK